MKQLFYSNWGDPKAPKDYFSKVSAISEIISALLMAPVEGYAAGYFSSIQVHQSKEKFGEARVYCELCCLEKVKVLYNTDTATKDMLKSDMSHYREVYKKVIRLFPQYEKAIRYGCDFPALLLDSKEEYIELAAKYSTGFAKSDDTLELLTEVCGWK